MIRSITLLIVFCFFAVSCFAQDIDHLDTKKPFAYSGTLNLNIIGYNIAGLEPRMSPFNYAVSGDFNASLYGVILPFSFTYSSKQKSYSQPFNQFGISPRYKWITAHIGYRNITFSKFTLSGHSFLGGGLELNPGKFRFGAMYGRFNKNTQPNPNDINDSLVTFKRKGVAVKLGVGSDKNYFDIMFMNAKDDSLSAGSAEFLDNSAPAENTVAGFNSKFYLTKKMFWETEAAYSVYTTDSRLLSFDNNLINNKLRMFNGLMALNISTEHYSAFSSSIVYKEKLYSAALRYKRIEPGFKSMGAYYFSSDLENITLNPTTSFFKRKLNMNLSSGFQRDNLKNNKRASSVRWVNAFGFSFNPNRYFGIDGNYTNFSTNQKAGRLPLYDSLKLYQATSNLTLTPRLMFADEKRSHLFLFMFTDMQLNDNNSFTANFTEMHAQIMQLTYNLNLTEQKIGYTFGAVRNKVSNYAALNITRGFNIGVNKILFSDKLVAAFNQSVLKSKIANTDGWIINSGLSTYYRYSDRHSVRFNFYLVGNSYPAASLNPSYTETKGDINYTYSF